MLAGSKEPGEGERVSGEAEVKRGRGERRSGPKHKPVIRWGTATTHTNHTFGKSFVLLVGKEAEGGRKPSLEKGLGRFRRKVLFKGSSISKRHLMISRVRHEVLPHRWAGGAGAGPGGRNSSLCIWPPPPYYRG